MKSVLVIDDDMAVQRHCRDILETEGFGVFCESSLGSARRYLRRQKADAILLDLFLPDGCGYELFNSKDLVKEVPVIAMTGVYQGSANARLLCLRHPFRAVLPKPIQVASLLGALRGVFEGAYPEPPDWVNPQSGSTVVVEVESAMMEMDAAPNTAVVVLEHRTGATFDSLPSVGDFVSPLDPAGSSPLEAIEGHAAGGDLGGWDPLGGGDVPSTRPYDAVDPELLRPAGEGEGQATAGEPSKAEASVASTSNQPLRGRRARAEAAPPALVSDTIDLSLSPRNPDSEGLLVPESLDPRKAPLQGKLGETPLPSILTRLARSGGTGSLLLRREKVKKIVFLEKGVPIAVKSNLLYECLGQMLVREGIISESICEGSVERLKAEKRLQGDILVEMGAISEADLEEALLRQYESKFHAIFTWSEGLFQYRTSSLGRVHKVAAGDPYSMVLSGIRRGSPADRISIDLSPFMTQSPTLLVTRGDLDSLNLNEAEQDWLRLLDNRRSLGNILNVTGGAEGIYRLFYGLVCLGLLAFRPREMSYTPSP